MKEKRGEKRRFLSFSVPVHIFLKKEKEEETKEKILIQKWKFERNAEGWNTRFQGQEKKKTLSTDLVNKV